MFGEFAAAGVGEDFVDAVGFAGVFLGEFGLVPEFDGVEGVAGFVEGELGFAEFVFVEEHRRAVPIIIGAAEGFAEEFDQLARKWSLARCD